MCQFLNYGYPYVKKGSTKLNTKLAWPFECLVTGRQLAKQPQRSQIKKMPLKAFVSKFLILIIALPFILNADSGGKPAVRTHREKFQILIQGCHG